MLCYPVWTLTSETFIHTIFFYFRTKSIILPQPLTLLLMHPLLIIERQGRAGRLCPVDVCVSAANNCFVLQFDCFPTLQYIFAVSGRERPWTALQLARKLPLLPSLARLLLITSISVSYNPLCTQFLFWCNSVRYLIRWHFPSLNVVFIC